MSLIDRFLTAFRGEDRGAAEPPGLLLDVDGVTWVISPDGSRTRVDSGGSSSLLWASFQNTDTPLIPANGSKVLGWEANRNGAGTLGVTLADLGDGADTTFQLPDLGVYLVTLTVDAGPSFLVNGSDPASVAFEIVVLSNDKDPYLTNEVIDPTGTPVMRGATSAVIITYEVDFDNGFQVQAFPFNIDFHPHSGFPGGWVVAEVKIVQLATT